MAPTRSDRIGKSQRVLVRSDEPTADLVGPPAPVDWDELFAVIDAAGFPEDFLAHRDQGISETREPIRA